MKQIARMLLAAALSALIPAGAQAQSWPTRPVTLVLGYTAGSGIDSVARFLADALRERTGQPWIVENRPGASTNIAARHVARAAPDGYTVLFTASSSHGVNPSLFKSLGFDPIKDFQPVTSLLSIGFVLVVNPRTVPVNSVAELTAYLKARPGKLAFASGNPSGRLAAEWYRQIAGFDAVHVPYKGEPQAITDMLGGDIHFMFLAATMGVPTAKSGKLRALAVTNPKRLASMPQVPTMMESGVSGYEVFGWFGLFLPAGAPMDVARRLAELSNAIMGSEKGREYLNKLGTEPYPGTPESFAKLVAAEIAKWGPIARAAGIQPE